MNFRIFVANDCKMKNERLEQLRQMLEKTPNDIFVRYAIGLELYKTEDFASAIQHMKMLASEHPSYCPVHFKLGQWYSENDNIEEAVNWLTKALRIAEKENDPKAINEIREALWLLED